MNRLLVGRGIINDMRVFPYAVLLGLVHPGEAELALLMQCVSLCRIFQID